MSEFGGDGPRFEGEYHPTFDELQSRVETHGPTGLFEFATTGEDGISLITPASGSALETQKEIWLDEGGNCIEPFNNKYAHGFDGWQPGTIVNADYDVIEKDGQLTLKVSSWMGGQGAGDHFVLQEPTEEQRAQLQNIGIAHVTADVQVTSVEQPITLSYSKHDGRIHRIHTVQEPWDGEAPLQPHQEVLVAGPVVSYNPNRQEQSDASHAITIQLANGTTVPVQLMNGYMVFRGGTIELLRESEPEPGDVIQIQARTADSAGDVVIKAYPGDSYLQKPNDARLAAYQAERVTAAAHIAALDGKTGSAFRAAYSDLMHSALRTVEPGRWESSPHYYTALTRAEQTAIQVAIDAAFPPGSPERPVVTDTEGAEDVVRIATAYSGQAIDPYKMSRQEFYDFYRDVVSGNITAITGSHPDDSLCCVLRKADFPPEEELALHKQAVEYAKQHTSGKRLAEYRQPPDPATEVAWHETYMAGKAMDRIGKFAKTSPELRDYLYDTLLDVVQGTLAYENSADSAQRELIPASCSGLITALFGGVEVDSVKRLRAADQDHLAYFTEKVPQLTRLAEQLEAAGDQLGSSNVNRLIAKITRVASLPPKS